MGRRHPKARFLPGILVFPGGRLEAKDFQPSGFAERFSMAPRGLDAASRAKWQALVRCALRETWEETGILVGEASENDKAEPRQEHWQAFASAGVSPSLPTLRLLARAITPTDSPIRFHTRFFFAKVTDGLQVHNGDGELKGVTWISSDQALREDLVDVTRFMLERALSEGATDPAPLFHYQGETRLVDLPGRRLVWQESAPI